MVKHYWKTPLLRFALSDGTTGFAPLRPLLIVGLSQLILMIALSFPVWFLGRCVFLDDIQFAPEMVCQPFPALTVSTWFLAILALAIMGVCYVGLYRLSIRNGWQVRLGNMPINAADGFSLMCGFAIGSWWAGTMFGPDEISSWGRLVVALAGPGTIWLWRAHLFLWTRTIATRWLTNDEVTAVTARLLIQQSFRRRTAREAKVVFAEGKLTVQGAFDAIDALRIEDLIATYFTEPIVVAVESLLSDEDYWRAYRSELSRSGYVGKPIPAPLSVPASGVTFFLAAFAVLLVIALRYGPGLAPGISADDIAGFYGRQNMLPQQVEPGSTTALAHTSRVSFDEDELFRAPPFEIDVEGSKEVCPGLLLYRSHPNISRMTTENMIGPYVAPDDPNNLMRYGDIVVRVHYLGIEHVSLFLIERATGLCIQELPFTSTATARDVGSSLPGVIPGAWETSLRGDDDWGYVPPLPQGE